MGFLSAMEEERPEERRNRGKYQKVAVGCWFTASGKVIPLMVKFPDEEGHFCVLRDICVKKTEQKYYAGTLMQRYDCSVTTGQREINFILLYHPETNLWDLVLPRE